MYASRKLSVCLVLLSNRYSEICNALTWPEAILALHVYHCTRIVVFMFKYVKSGANNWTSVVRRTRGTLNGRVLIWNSTTFGEFIAAAET